jgi:transcriptional regulator with XRE-family HTH domain
MYSPAPLVDSRGAAYARLASRVLECLNDAVQLRQSQGATRTEIADRMGCHRSQLSRILNGTLPNLTLRTISDVFWATDHEPRDLTADPVEALSANCPTHRHHERDYLELFRTRSPTFDIDFSKEVTEIWLSQQPSPKVTMELAIS